MSLDKKINKEEDSLVIPKEHLEKWISALRSGKYKQTEGTLNNEGGYCCLGVACHVLMPRKDIKKNLDGFIDGGLPDDQEKAPEWLKKINNDFYNRVYKVKRGTESLAGFNDMGLHGNKITKEFREVPLTFDEIADAIELVYVHKALD